mmetsp:Transcript_67194/g.160966  ORF Transcript_67194/g.160966 Transcript_67194/m.160966 type:complete len:214 (-) Transcript_67194:1871-2512(-)
MLDGKLEEVCSRNSSQSGRHIHGQGPVASSSLHEVSTSRGVEVEVIVEVVEEPEHVVQVSRHRLLMESVTDQLMDFRPSRHHECDVGFVADVRNVWDRCGCEWRKCRCCGCVCVVGDIGDIRSLGKGWYEKARLALDKPSTAIVLYASAVGRIVKDALQEGTASTDFGLRTEVCLPGDEVRLLARSLCGIPAVQQATTAIINGSAFVPCWTCR